MVQAHNPSIREENAGPPQLLEGQLGSPLKSQANQGFRVTSHLRTKARKNRVLVLGMASDIRQNCGKSTLTMTTTMYPKIREGPPTWSNANGGGMGACDLCFMGV